MRILSASGPGTYRIHTPFGRPILGLRQHEPKLFPPSFASCDSASATLALVRACSRLRVCTSTAST